MGTPREGGDLARSTTTTTMTTQSAASTSNAVPAVGLGATGAEPHHHHQHRQQLERSSDGDSLDTMTQDQRRAILEELAQRLVDDVLDDAFELYLRRELQQTAEETVREALAAAGAGRTKTAEQEGDSVSGMKPAVAVGRSADLDELADEEMSSGGEDEPDDDDDEGEGEAESTLTRDLAPAGLMSVMSSELGDGDDQLRAYSTSPSRLDGGDIFNDLSEMSNFADRIDSILDQTVSENSTRSGRMRSVSPMPQMMMFEHEQQQSERDNQTEEAGAGLGDGGDDDEVD